MINGGRNRSRNPCQADLSYATRSIFVQNKIRIIQKRYVDLWGIGIYRHAIICQVVVDRMSSLRIVARFFKERHTDAHHDRALDLSPFAKSPTFELKRSAQRAGDVH